MAMQEQIRVMEKTLLWASPSEFDLIRMKMHEEPPTKGRGFTPWRLSAAIPSDGWRLQLYEFLATPAHIWLWCCAKICGGDFECGPVDSEPD